MAEPLWTFCGTLGFRGTPVERHCCKYSKITIFLSFLLGKEPEKTTQVKATQPPPRVTEKPRVPQRPVIPQVPIIPSLPEQPKRHIEPQLPQKPTDKKPEQPSSEPEPPSPTGSIVIPLVPGRNGDIIMEHGQAGPPGRIIQSGSGRPQGADGQKEMEMSKGFAGAPGKFSVK